MFRPHTLGPIRRWRTRLALRLQSSEDDAARTTSITRHRSSRLLKGPPARLRSTTNPGPAAARRASWMRQSTISTHYLLVRCRSTRRPSEIGNTKRAGWMWPIASSLAKLAQHPVKRRVTRPSSRRRRRLMGSSNNRIRGNTRRKPRLALAFACSGPWTLYLHFFFFSHSTCHISHFCVLHPVTTAS